MHPTSSLSSGFSSILVSFLRSIRAVYSWKCVAGLLLHRRKLARASADVMTHLGL